MFVLMSWVLRSLLFAAAAIGLTVTQSGGAVTPIVVTVSVPHDDTNNIMCAGINDKKDYDFADWACWNVSLNDFPGIPESFEQSFAPRETPGTYYAGAVLYRKTKLGIGSSITAPLTAFEVK